MLSVVHGVLYGTFMAVGSSVFLHGDWIGAVVGGFVGGVLFGAVMGPVAYRLNSPARETVGSMAPTSQRAALRAVLRGPVPEDQQIREAAHRLVIGQLVQMGRLRTFSIVAFAVAEVVYVVLALTFTPWWWAAAALFAVMLAHQLWLPHHLQHRAELLRGPRRSG